MWSRKQWIAQSPPIETWPEVFVDSLCPSEKEHYLARVCAITLYHANEPVAKITQVTGIAACSLPRLARKCSLMSDDGRILGFRALLPYVRCEPYTRIAAEKPKFPEAQGGLSGVFNNLLARFPDIEGALINHITQDAKLKAVPEFRLRPRDLHRIFVKLLKEKGVSGTEWPFTTKHLGKRSIERYMLRLLDRNFALSVTTRENQEARAHLNVGTGSDPFLIYDEPYAAVEIDAYKIESHLSVAIQTPEGTETEVVLDRLWLIAAVDRFSSAILSYLLVYRSEVNADDVLRVIRDAATGQWSPRSLTIPIRYPTGGGLPSGVVPNAFGAVWTSLLLDGALAHLSKAVHDRARKALGFSINWGPVGHFERRPNVEKTFDKVGKELFRRLPSTTGGGPLKGRADDAQKKAVRYRIRASDTEQLLDVTFAQHNLLPTSGKSFLSPIDVLNQFLESPQTPFLVRHLPKQAFEYAKKLALRVVAIVRGGRKAGRRPYIQLDGVHYTNPVLANAGHLVGKALNIEIDEEDYRQVRAFLNTGAELGVLKAHGKWGLTKHSVRTRKAIMSLVSNRTLVLSEFDDPIQIYMRHIAQPVPGQKGKKITSRQATQLTQLANDAGQAVRIPAPEKVQVVAAAEPSRITNSLINLDVNFFSRVKNRR